MSLLQSIKEATERKYSRSSGPGGQHVNKSETKVQLSFDIQASSLSDDKKQRLMKKHPSGLIQVQSQETRSQTRNEEIAFAHLEQQIRSGLKVQKKRRKTKAPHQTKMGKFKKAFKAHLMKYRRRNIDREG